MALIGNLKLLFVLRLTGVNIVWGVNIYQPMRLPEFDLLIFSYSLCIALIHNGVRDSEKHIEIFNGYRG